MRPVFRLDAKTWGGSNASKPGRRARRSSSATTNSKLVVRRNWSEGDDRVKGAFAIARDLAKIVTEAKKVA